MTRQRRADGDHEICVGETFPCDLGRETAGDVEIEGVGVEKPACRQGRCKQPVKPVGKRLAGRAGTGRGRAKAAHDDDPVRTVDHCAGGI